MIRCALVGCGNIAGFLDTPESDFVLTHAHAIALHPQTTLVACCDTDEHRIEAFKQRWGQSIAAYPTHEAMIQNEAIDLLVICSPTPYHAAALKTALNDPHIQTIICEKPFVETSEEFDALRPLLEQSHKRVVINFIRRFNPGIREIAALIAGGTLGELRHFSGTFTKGLYHNGSHMLELIEHLCGEITHLHALKCAQADQDYFGTFFLKTSRCHGNIQNADGNHYALFELDITLSLGRIRILDSGHRIVIESPFPSPYYEGYFNLAPARQLEDTMKTYALHTIEFALHEDVSTVFDHHLRLSQKLLRIKTTLSTHSTIDWRNDV